MPDALDTLFALRGLGHELRACLLVKGGGTHPTNNEAGGSGRGGGLNKKGLRART